MHWFYMLCFFLGVIYAIVSMIFSGIFGQGGAHADFGGHDLNVGGGDMGVPDPGHADFVGTHEMVHFSPLSPIVIAVFVTAFGAGGLITMDTFNQPEIVHVPVAVVSGLVCSLGTFLMLSWIMEKTQGSTHYRAEEAVGSPAEVTISIPASGLGQIAFDAKGQRQTGSARTEDGHPIAAHTIVRVEKTVGGTYYVREASSAPAPPEA
ncbi:MAG: hypothetical protein HYY93_02470 [Planctomycetes bacterium]|nr:hypothetical protein [Planctomycetota bacterium]